jgi:hypothetical protein
LAEFGELLTILDQALDLLNDGGDAGSFLVLLLELEVAALISVGQHDLEIVIIRIFGRGVGRLLLLLLTHLLDFGSHVHGICSDTLETSHDGFLELFTVTASLALDRLSHINRIVGNLLKAGKNRLDDLLITVILRLLSLADHVC